MLRKREEKQRKVSGMNSLPLYPISTFTADCKIPFGAGSWQSWRAARGARCPAVAPALRRCLGAQAGCRGPSSPAGPRPRVPPPGRDSLQLWSVLLSFVG